MTVNNYTIQPIASDSGVVLAAQPSEIGVREMSSLEIAEVTGKRHDSILRDIRNLLEQGVAAHNFVESYYTDKSNRKSPCFNLTKKGSLILASGYNAILREKIIDRWEALETGQATPIYQVIQQQTQQPVYSLEEKFKAIELSCKMLRKSAASKARMVNALIAPMGLPTFDFVESEGQFLSATDALAKYPVIYKGKNLAAVTFNKILIEKGYLEDVPQPRNKTSLKLLTEKGLKWGKNEDVPEHPGSIIAHYNMKKFPDFLKELGLK